MLVNSLESWCHHVIIRQFYQHQCENVHSVVIDQLQLADVSSALAKKILSTLIVDHAETITDDVLNLLQHPSFPSLHIQQCKKISLSGLAAVLKKSNHSVVSLDLSDCDQLVNDKLPQILKKNTKHLIDLRIENCASLKDDILHNLLLCCPNLKTLSVDGCENILDLSFYYPLQDHSFAQNITTVNLSGCQSISCTFIRYLAAVCGHNLCSVNISWTNVNCIALVFLAGYDLSLAVRIASNNIDIEKLLNPVGIVENCCSSQELPYKNDLHNCQISSVFPDDQGLSENHGLVPVLGSSDRSASFYVKELCAYCTQDIAMRQLSETNFDVFTESYDDYEVIDSQVVELFQNDKLLLNKSDAFPETFLSDWAILTVDDVHLSLKNDYCTCIEPITVPQSNSSNSIGTVIQGHLKEDKMHFPKQTFIPKIRYLDVSQIDFHDFDVGKRCLELFMKSNKDSLQQFHTSWQQLDDDLLKCIATSASSLQCLSLVDCERITSKGILELSNRCKSLKLLDLKGVPFVGYGALLQLISANQSLQKLSLAATAATDVVLKGISESCSDSLHHLDLSWCDNITNEGVSHILLTCNKLTSLDLRQCEVWADIVNSIIKYGTNLTELGLCSIKGLNNSYCQMMVKSLPYLQKIDMSWNSSLTDDAIYSLFHFCVRLREVTIFGLKCITSKPFLPIITGYVEWHRVLEVIRKRLLPTVGHHRSNYLSDFEIKSEEFYLPFRSVNYAPDLKKLTLGYCDKVNDNDLAEIVAVCRTTLMIEDYYGETVKPKWNKLYQNGE